MNIKKDFNIEIIPLFNFKHYSQVLEYYRESKQLEFNVVLTNKKTSKKCNIIYKMGCGFLTIERNSANRAINISGEYMKEIKNLRINNAIRPTESDIIESIELDLSTLQEYTMGEFIEEFGHKPSEGIDVYNSIIAEYNNLKSTY